MAGKNKKSNLPTYVDDHLPSLVPVEEEEEDVGHEKKEQRLLQGDVDSYIRANMATELAIEKDKEKYLKTFENVVHDHCNEW